MSAASENAEDLVHLALPKGRMQDAVFALLADAGIRLTFGRRGYRPTLSLAGFEAKILKPQNIVEMLHLGSRDVGFAGADWVAGAGRRAGRAARHRPRPGPPGRGGAGRRSRTAACPAGTWWWPPNTSG